MGFALRNKGRYGLFKANSDIGEVKIDICVYGFGEKIEVYKNKELIDYVDTSDGEDWDWIETNDYIDVGHTRVHKPFIRCLKRY